VLVDVRDRHEFPAPLLRHPPLIVVPGSGTTQAHVTSGRSGHGHDVAANAHSLDWHPDHRFLAEARRSDRATCRS
jgi:hypothetical protein